MTTMRLGESELEPTRVVLGAWAFGGWMWGGQKEEDSIEAVHASLDAGIRAIDTAPVYGFGRSEETVGKALREHSGEVPSQIPLRNSRKGAAPSTPWVLAKKWLYS